MVGGTTASIGRGELRSDVLAMLCQLRGEPAMTTEEIAEVTRQPRNTVRARLEALEERGEIKSAAPPHGSRWWCVPDSDTT